MSVLIDVNNVLHVVGVLPPDLAGIDVEELGDLIQKSRFRRDHVVFVCDGKRRRHMTTPDIKVVFSGAGVSADDVIIGMVDRSTAPRRLTVVSNDREITTAAVIDTQPSKNQRFCEEKLRKKQNFDAISTF